MVASQGVDDVTALKMAHASLNEMSESTMRGLLSGLLTATAADKPACFVAVRVARAIVQRIHELDPQHREQQKRQDACGNADEVGVTSRCPVPRLKLDQGSAKNEESCRSEERTGNAQNGAAAMRRQDASSPHHCSESERSSSSRSTSRSTRAGGSHSSRSAGSHTSRGSGGSTSRRNRAPVSGAESFLKPVERMTQAQRRERAKKQREHAALVAQRLVRGWCVRRELKRRAVAAGVIQRARKHRVWRHALAEAGRARKRRLAAEAAVAEKRAEDARQRAEFESWREFVSSAIPEELQSGSLLHYAAIQITAWWRGTRTRVSVLNNFGWSVSEVRKARAVAARDACERAARAAEDAARAREIERAQVAAMKAQLKKEEEARLVRAKKARAEIMAKKEREAKAKAVKSEAEKRMRERKEREAREAQEKADREGRRAQRVEEELRRRQHEQAERAAREQLCQQAEAEAEAKAKAAAAEWEAAHERLKAREAQYKIDTAAAVSIQRVVRGIRTRQMVAEQIAADAQAKQAEEETRRLMAEAAEEAERKASHARLERQRRHEEKEAAAADKAAEEERCLARKAAAHARTLASRAAQQAEAAATRRAEAAVAREARIRREEALLLQKRAEIEAVEWRSSSAVENANAVSRPASALPPVAIGVGWRGDTPLGTDHHHERREIDELRQMQDARWRRNSGPAARRGRSRPGSAPILSLSEWEWKMEADQQAANRPHPSAYRDPDHRAKLPDSFTSGRAQSAKPRLLESSRGTTSSRSSSSRPRSGSMGANGEYSGGTMKFQGQQRRRGRSAGPARTSSSENRDAEMRRSAEAMEEFLHGCSLQGMATDEEEEQKDEFGRQLETSSHNDGGAYENEDDDRSDDHFSSSGEMSENDSSHYLDRIESARRDGYDSGESLASDAYRASSPDSHHRSIGNGHQHQHSGAFDSAIDRVASALSATGKLQELSPERPPYAIEPDESRARRGACCNKTGRLQDSTNLSNFHKRRPMPHHASDGSGSRGANKLAALPREAPNGSPPEPRKPKWENPLQVAARNAMRASAGRGGDSEGDKVAELDIGQEEIHRLLADLVSTVTPPPSLSPLPSLLRRCSAVLGGL